MKVWSLVKRVVLFELRLWRSLYRWVFRRPERLGPDAATFSYAGAITPVIVGIIVVSFIEIPVAHMLIPWKPLQIVLLVVGIQSVLWMIGLLAGMRIHPHVVADAGLRIRSNTSIDITIPWDDIASLRSRMRSTVKSRTIQLDESVLSIVVASQTNVDVVLREPISVKLPTGPSEPIKELRFFADDSTALLKAARARLVVDSRD